MSGLKSRRKGMRGEYLIRDILRSYGYQVDRVPASGASQGFKGDLRLRSATKELLIEVKLRSRGFATLYKVVANMNEGELGACPVQGALISTHPVNVIDHEFKESVFVWEDTMILKALNMCKKLIVGADILVLKADHKAPIYIKWVKRG